MLLALGGHSGVDFVQSFGLRNGGKTAFNALAQRIEPALHAADALKQPGIPQRGNGPAQGNWAGYLPCTNARSAAIRSPKNIVKKVSYLRLFIFIFVHFLYIKIADKYGKMTSRRPKKASAGTWGFFR